MTKRALINSSPSLNKTYVLRALEWPTPEPLSNIRVNFKSVFWPKLSKDERVSGTFREEGIMTKRALINSSPSLNKTYVLRALEWPTPEPLSNIRVNFKSVFWPKLSKDERVSGTFREEGIMTKRALINSSPSLNKTYVLRALEWPTPEPLSNIRVNFKSVFWPKLSKDERVSGTFREEGIMTKRALINSSPSLNKTYVLWALEWPTPEPLSLELHTTHNSYGACPHPFRE